MYTSSGKDDFKEFNFFRDKKCSWKNADIKFYRLKSAISFLLLEIKNEILDFYKNNLLN